MRMRLLGTTGLQVSEICLGTSNFNATGAYGKTGNLDQGAADRLVSIALDCGINCFNTAEIYSDGNAESALGRALGKRREDAIVITKVHPGCTPESGVARPGRSLADACDASLRRLRTDYIDVYELHFFDPDTPLETTLQQLDVLVRAGKVRFVGCSNFAAWQLMKGLGISRQRGWAEFSTLEAMYSLAARGLELEVLPACVDQGVALLAFSPLHGGFLTGKYRRGEAWPDGTRFDRMESAGPWPVEPESLYRIVDELQAVAADRGVSASQVALNYVLSKEAVCSLVVGARTVEQLEENVEATKWDMTTEEVARLDAASAPVRKYPYEIFDPLEP